MSMIVETFCGTLCNNVKELFNLIKFWLDANVLRLFAGLLLIFLASWLFLELAKRILDFLRKYIDKIKMFVSVLGTSTAMLLFFIILQTFFNRSHSPSPTTSVLQQDDCKQEVGKDKKKNSKRVRKENQKDSKSIGKNKGKC